MGLKFNLMYIRILKNLNFYFYVSIYLYIYTYTCVTLYEPFDTYVFMFLLTSSRVHFSG